MLLEYSFEPTPNKPALLGTAGLSYDHPFIKKRKLALEKSVWREQTILTSLEIWAAATPL